MRDEFSEPNVCVVLTALNDQKSIYPAVKEFSSQRYVKSVIVVENNSEDETKLLAQKAGAKVITEKKRGYGFTIIAGLKEALKEEVDIIVLSEGDMTFFGKDISKMMPYLEDVDMVIGSRTQRVLVDIDSQMDWFYTIGNLFLSKLLEIKFFDTKYWSKVSFSDVGCTYRAIKKDALKKIIDQLEVGGHHFSPHMTLLAIKNNLKVIEIPIKFRKRVGKSKGAGGNKGLAIKVGIKMFWEIISR